MGLTITVAAAQTGPVLTEDPAASLAGAKRMFAAAAEKRADLLAFSELFLTPFFPNRLTKEFDHYFVPEDGPVMTALAEMAREHGIAAILPFAEKTEAGYFNSALVVDKEGRRFGIYRKTHIPAYFPSDRPGGTGSFEKLYFAPGAALPVFEVAGTKIGIQICNDRLYPEPSRALALAGAEIIVMPICYSTYGDPAHRASIWPVPLRARAYENGAFVVAANRVGLEGPRQHLGRSMIIDPRGTILVEASDTDEALIAQSIDLACVTEARKDFPWWRDRRPDLYGPLVR